jgi:hypothetical protein
MVNDTAVIVRSRIVTIFSILALAGGRAEPGGPLVPEVEETKTPTD